MVVKFKNGSGNKNLFFSEKLNCLFKKIAGKVTHF